MTDVGTFPSGLEAVLVANREPLLRFLRARGAGENAEDLLQEAWLRAAAQSRSPIANPRSYLFRIANNLMIDHHRAATQRSARERDWSDVHGGTAFGNSNEPGADDRLAALDMLARVTGAIDELGEPTITISGGSGSTACRKRASRTI
ncbi:MAG: RNA polymerase sigma factor [Sphingopyxis sp.]|nr:RNA polymerase sigma factor [Sphingopyxis sp.]